MGGKGKDWERRRKGEEEGCRGEERRGGVNERKGMKE
jgi:hypothetical protein